MSDAMSASGDHFVISLDWAPKIGGAHLWLYEVYKRWPRPVSVFTEAISTDPEMANLERLSDEEGHGSIKVVRNALPMHDLDALSIRFWRNLLGNASALRSVGEKPGDWLHCLRAFPEGMIGLARKRLDRGKSRLITYLHGEEILIAKTSRFLEIAAKHVYRNSDLVIANSENSRRLLKTICPDVDARVIHPGVDVESFEQLSGDRSWRDKWGWGSETTVVCTIARMEPRKNQKGVIEAIAILAEEGARIGYVCAGVGPEQDSLRALVKDLGIEERIRLPGRVSEEEKRLVYAAADIHAMPSIETGAVTEGFGIVFLEAAAASVPSVAGCVGGQSEAVLDGRTGIVVDGKNPSEIAAALRRLIREPELRREMGASALLWARENDWAKVSQRTYETLSEPLLR